MESPIPKTVSSECCTAVGEARAFQLVDWSSFGLATVLTLAMYLWTLTPEVGLQMSGLLSTAAMYGGVAHTPGFPLWTLYAWLFATLLPFANIAWRVAISSAVAGSLTCGVVAVIVSRNGRAIIEGIAGLKRLTPKEEKLLRLIAGAIAGMCYGFNGVTWGTAVVADTRPLANLLFSVVLFLLIEWSYEGSKRFLYGAFLVFGLTISASPILLPGALGLPFFVIFLEASIGRDLFFAAATLSAVIVFTSRRGLLPLLDAESHGSQIIYFWIGVLAGTMWIGLIIKTRRVFTKWRPSLIAGLLSIVGMSLFLYLPVASMTNPPSNWGYARTVEGFFHVLRRGQFERLSPTDSFPTLILQLGMYVHTAIKQFGPLSLLAALVPFYFMPRMSRQHRAVMLGLLAFFLSTSVLMTILLNPPGERDTQSLFDQYFSASFLILAIWTGFGLILWGSIISRETRTPEGLRKRLYLQ
jgi:hypothetical protein